VPVIFQDGAVFEVGRNSDFERLINSFRVLNTVTLAPGDYLFNSYFVSYKTNNARKLAFNANVNKGDFYNGVKTTSVVGGTVRLNYRFGMTTTFTRNDIDLPISKFKTNLVSTRMNYSF